jgi:hypothetical protein
VLLLCLVDYCYVIEKVIVVCCASFSGLVQCPEGDCSVGTHSSASLHVPLIFVFQTGSNSWFHNSAGCPSQDIELHVMKLPECFDTLLYYNGIGLSRMVFFFKWWRAPQQTLRTHCSHEAYCATVWWRWRWLLFFVLFLVMEHRWNEIERGKRKNLGKNMSQCHFVHHKSHMDWPGIEPGPPRWEAAANRLSHGTAEWCFTETGRAVPLSCFAGSHVSEAIILV